MFELFKRSPVFKFIGGVILLIFIVSLVVLGYQSLSQRKEIQYQRSIAKQYHKVTGKNVDAKVIKSPEDYDYYQNSMNRQVAKFDKGTFLTADLHRFDKVTMHSDVPNGLYIKYTWNSPDRNKLIKLLNNYRKTKGHVPVYVIYGNVESSFDGGLAVYNNLKGSQDNLAEYSHLSGFLVSEHSLVKSYRLGSSNLYAFLRNAD